jgi:hypothetical protein
MQRTNHSQPDTDTRQSTVITTSNGSLRTSGKQLNNRKQYMTIGTGQPAAAKKYAKTLNPKKYGNTR